MQSEESKTEMDKSCVVPLTRSLEYVNSQRKKTELWLAGMEEGQNEKLSFNEQRVSVWEDEKSIKDE